MIPKNNLSISGRHTCRVHTAQVCVFVLSLTSAKWRALFPQSHTEVRTNVMTFTPSVRVCAAHCTAADLQCGGHTNTKTLGCSTDRPLILTLVGCCSNGGLNTVCVASYDDVNINQTLKDPTLLFGLRNCVASWETIKQTFYRKEGTTFYSMWIKESLKNLDMSSKQVVCCCTTWRVFKVWLVLYLSFRETYPYLCDLNVIINAKVSKVKIMITWEAVWG